MEFKVGDKVRFKDDPRGTVCKIVKIFGDGSLKIKVPGEPSDQFGWQPDEVELVNSRACNSWKPATGGVCVGDLVIHKAQYQAHKNDEEWLDRNCTRVKTVTAEGFQDKWSGTYEFENPKDYMVLNSRVCNSRNPVVAKALNARAVRNSVTQIEVTDLKTGEKRVLDIGELKAHHYGLGKELSDYELFLLGDKALLRAKSPTHQYRVVNESVRNASDAEIEQHLLIKSDSRYPGEDGKTTVKFSRLPESVKEDMRENYDILKSGRVSVFSSRFNGHNWAVSLNRMVANNAKWTVDEKELLVASSKQNAKKSLTADTATYDMGGSYHRITKVREGLFKVDYDPGTDGNLPKRSDTFYTLEDALSDIRASGWRHLSRY